MMSNKIVLKDEVGNNITAIRQNSDMIQIELKLLSEKYSRKIGYVDTSSNTFVVKRERSKHLHYKSNSYGFNYRVIKDGKRFDKVMLHDEYGEYVIPKEVILNHGRFLFFKEEGFEKQIFLPLPMIEKYKQNL